MFACVYLCACLCVRMGGCGWAGSPKRATFPVDISRTVRVHEEVRLRAAIRQAALQHLAAVRRHGHGQAPVVLEASQSTITCK